MAGYVFPDPTVTGEHGGAIGSATFKEAAVKGTRTGIFIFPETSHGWVYDTNLTSYIHKPVSGQYPEIINGSAHYTVEITEWSPSVPEDGYGFEVDVSYTATVTLTVKKGWQFRNEVVGEFSHDAAEKVTDQRILEEGQGQEFSLKIEFPPTQEEEEGEGEGEEED
jgi:hypothetical protein